jgi:hypothetical protein
MMNTDTLIEKILISQHYKELFSRFTFRKQYIDYMKVLHPDVCSHPQAHEAVAKINIYKEELEKSNKLSDDAGILQVISPHEVILSGDKALLKKSQENYQRLLKLNDKASLHFRKYLPESMDWQGDTLVIRHKEAFAPLSGLLLEERHVTWLTSRLFEFTAWLHQVGFCHSGLNPESVAIVPETHGIVILSFYHLTYNNQKLTTISNRYLNWYPHSVFSEKRATAYVDLTLAQRIALYVLGDKTGSGVKLKKTCTPQLIDFLLESHQYPYETFDAYRKLLEKLFGKPKFYTLEL